MAISLHVGFCRDKLNGSLGLVFIHAKQTYSLIDDAEVACVLHQYDTVHASLVLHCACITWPELVTCIQCTYLAGHTCSVTGGNIWSVMRCVRLLQSAPSGQLGSEGFDYGAAELPGERAARIQAEIHAAAAAAVDELDPEILRNAAPAPAPDREIMVYDDI